MLKTANNHQLCKKKKIYVLDLKFTFKINFVIYCIGSWLSEEIYLKFTLFIIEYVVSYIIVFVTANLISIQTFP